MLKALLSITLIARLSVNLGSAKVSPSTMCLCANNVMIYHNQQVQISGLIYEDFISRVELKLLNTVKPRVSGVKEFRPK